MKSNEKVVIFTAKQTFLFQQLMEQTYNKSDLALPHTLPMIAYQWIDIPWKLHPPVIHRKQQCTMHIPMIAHEKYNAYVTLDEQYTRKNFTFSKQTLHMSTLHGGVPCYTGTMYLASGVKI